MNSKGVRFGANANSSTSSSFRGRGVRREPVSRRFERNLAEFERQNTPKRAANATEMDKTLINQYRIERLQPFVVKSGGILESTECSECESSSDSTSTLSYLSTSESETDVDAGRERRLRESLSLLNRDCKKIVRGRDLLDIYSTLTRWFNGLRDVLTVNSTETDRPADVRRDKRTRSTPASSSRLHFEPRIHSTPKANERMGSFKAGPTTDPASSSTIRVIYDDVCQITGNLNLDHQLILKYVPSQHIKPWSERTICDNVKYKCFTEKKCNFYDSLTIVPGIGPTYSSRLCRIIPNVGTLVELYLTVDESTFKTLLKSYANVNHFNLNLIHTSCRHYVAKFGFTFSDVRIHLKQ